MRSRGSAFRYTNLSVGIGESAGLWPLLQQGVKDDVELLLVVSVGYDAGKGGVGVGGGGDRDWQGGVVLGSQNVLGMVQGNTLREDLHDVGGRLQRRKVTGASWIP